LQELEQMTLAPAFWDNQENAQKVQREQGAIQNIVDEWDTCQTELEEAELLLEMGMSEGDEATLDEVDQSLDALLERVGTVELECMFTGEHDASNAMLDLQPGDEAGVKSATIMITGHNAYGLLRSEMGIHRLVRISPFDASGRRHTSFASVFIFPELDDDIQVDINDKDLRIDTYRASGAGGQHVNKTSSAIRITHLPTGIVVQCQNERSQHRNKDTAMKMLKARLYEKGREAQKEQHQDIAGEKKEIAWGSQIRSYVMQPYRLIKDHRTNFEVGNVDSTLDGNLDPFIKAYLLWQR
jgi:peptide chain release factor 2